MGRAFEVFTMMLLAGRADQMLSDPRISLEDKRAPRAILLHWCMVVAPGLVHLPPAPESVR